MSDVFIATKTIAAIEQTMAHDQGASFRTRLETLLPKMDDAYRGKDDAPYRSHLGISLIGKECARDLWYGFRWAQESRFPARVLRLFNRGHLEEARFIALLEMIGVTVWYETMDGGQFRVSHFNGHLGSALDGVVQNVPDLPPRAVAYAEFKTSALKAFKAVKKDGVFKAKEQHYTQMQLCMYKNDLPYGLYMVVHKDTDELYAEIIELDRVYAERFLRRGSNIIFSNSPPEKIGTNAAWSKCRFCDFKELCHGTDMPDINCRTCLHSQALEDGSWTCNRAQAAIAITERFRGCPQHIFNPTMLNGVKLISIKHYLGYVELEMPTKEIIRHGPDYVTSADLTLDNGAY